MEDTSEVGYVVVIKRSGKDGTSFPMNQDTCSIGCCPDSDIRVQLESVSMQHAAIVVQHDQQVGCVGLALSAIVISQKL